MILNFPNIDYAFWLENWNNSIGSKSVYLSTRSMDYCSFRGNITDCSNLIEKRVKAILDSDLNNSKASILEVLDLVYAWGGRSGRMFYFNRNRSVPRQEIESPDKFSYYLNGIELSRASNPEAIGSFKKVYGIGNSFASKNAYFWSVGAENRMVIVDSKISGALGFRTTEALLRYCPYGQIINEFTRKSLSEFNLADGSLVEKALFAFHNNYFLNDNSGERSACQVNRDQNAATTIIKKLLID
jgi:hypothetical protein